MLSFNHRTYAPSMADEANIIRSVLAAMKVRVGNHGGVHPEPISFQSTKARTYYLHIDAFVRPTRLAIELEDRLNHWLTSARGELTYVRIDTPPLRVEVPRLDPQYVPIYDVLPDVSRAYPDRPVLMLGEYYNVAFMPRDGMDRVPDNLALDLSKPANPHVLLGAGTGAGKTKLLQNLILGMSVISSPEYVRFLIIDPKAIHLGKFDLPHLVAPVVTDPVAGVGAIMALLAEMERRRKVFSANVQETGKRLAELVGPYIICFVDEAPEISVVGGVDVQDAIIRILRFGREVKIHLILATQQATNDYMEKLSGMKANLPVRIVGRVAQVEHGKEITGEAGRKINAQALTVGDFIAVYGGQIRRFHAYQIESEWLPDACAGVRKLWSQAVVSGRVMDLSARPEPAPARVTSFSIHPEKQAVPTSPERIGKQAFVDLLVSMALNGETINTSIVRSLSRERRGVGISGSTAAAMISEVRDLVIAARRDLGLADHDQENSHA